ncbi:hypothetical protein PFISCL1PPCAC_14342, partial [Pristionchus fissidentatus]
SLRRISHVTKYSVARSYQTKENITVIKALLRLAMCLGLLNVPIFVLVVCFRHFSGVELAVSGNFVHSIMDICLSLYPLVLISYIAIAD